MALVSEVADLGGDGLEVVDLGNDDDDDDESRSGSGRPVSTARRFDLGHHRGKTRRSGRWWRSKQW